MLICCLICCCCLKLVVFVFIIDAFNLNLVVILFCGVFASNNSFKTLSSRFYSNQYNLSAFADKILMRYCCCIRFKMRMRTNATNVDDNKDDDLSLSLALLIMRAAVDAMLMMS